MGGVGVGVVGVMLFLAHVMFVLVPMTLLHNAPLINRRYFNRTAALTGPIMPSINEHNSIMLKLIAPEAGSRTDTAKQT